jgi:hypothetical protein
MKNQACSSLTIFAVLCLDLGHGSAAEPQTPGAAKKGSAVTSRASGTFGVKATPQSSDDKGEGAPVGRFALDKQYHGELEAVGKGEMLTAGSPAKGSAGYVAIEKVRGTLGGRKGTFVLQHSGTMKRGALELTVRVVPDSGSGQLAGLEGKMTIKVAEGKHSYEMEYTLPAAPDGGR